MTDAVNPFAGRKSEALQRKEGELREAALLLKTDLQRVLRLPEGRRLVWHVLQDVCGVFASTEVPGSERMSLLRNGARGAGLVLQKELQDLAPAEFVLLLRENFERTLEQLPAQPTTREDR